MLVFRVSGEELQRLGPKGRDALWGIVEVDGEAVGFVTVGHVAEDVVVDVAEKVHLRLDAPVVAHVGEGGVAVEEARVPAAHLVIGDEISVLDALLLEDFSGFGEEVFVNPRGDGPMFFWDRF